MLKAASLNFSNSLVWQNNGICISDSKNVFKCYTNKPSGLPQMTLCIAFNEKKNPTKPKPFTCSCSCSQTIQE
jgi:hypothetical protein